jgi:hypothetical protein
MTCTTRVVLALASVLLAHVASAQTWTLVNGGGGTASITAQNFVNGEWNITIEAQGQPSVGATLRCNSGTDVPVRYVRVRSLRFGSQFSSLTLSVAENGGTIGLIREISKTADSTAEVTLHSVVITGDLGDSTTAHSGFVSADVIDEIHCNGDINADVTAGPRLFGGASNVDTVTTTGSLNGNVTAEYGGIEEVSASGDIGSGTNTVQIRTKDYLFHVFADTIWADIDTTRNSGIGDLWRLNTVVGDFHGSLKCHDLESPLSLSGLSIAGDLDANVTVTEDVKDPIVADSLSAGRLIKIGDSLQAPGGGGDTGNITLAAGGLEGQIIINSDNGGGTWTGAVTIGSTTLSGPYYTNLSSTLGGGAVGLAPFHLHDEDCVPANGSTQAIGMMTTIALRHYGPVQWTSGDPVEVYWRLNGSSGPWNVLDPADWTATAGADPRDIIVDTVNNFDFDALFDYKIVPSSNLKCKDVTGNPAVDSWEYYLYGH